ncbi:MAG TPA: DUF2934 domain-containing protein [Candidatus Acidoferrum sp.]|jgi:hypothetical protein|nr:DUF2934 domain-containing protein [Candidatus Acidoferrum sp.]
MKNKSDLSNKPTTEPLPEVALREQIERRAYHLWLAGGARHGEDLHHWLEAESEILKAVGRDQAERTSARKTNGTPKTRSSQQQDRAEPARREG